LENPSIFILSLPLSKALKIQSLFFFTLLALSIFGCNSKQKTDPVVNKGLSTNFKRVDSVYLTSNLAETSRLLDSLKPKIDANDINELTNFYYYKGLTSYKDTLSMNRYADSALAFFEDPNRQQQFPMAFAKALMLKSDVYVFFKKYDKALENYFKIKSTLNKTDDPLVYANYITRIAHLYYVQNLFKQAANYHLEAFNVLESVNGLDPRSMFHIKQGALNNAGFSYEKAGMLDSAAFLYRKGLSFIQQQLKQNTVTINQHNQSKIVLLDNLGGLMAKRGELKLAEQYLQESISLDSDAKEKIKITAFMKLADVYRRLNKLQKADSLLTIAKNVIQENPFDPYLLMPRWNKAKSELYLSKGNYKEAYRLLNRYSVAMDSINVENELSRVDLKVRFKNKQTEQDLKSLTKTNEHITFYLLCAAVFIIMLICIVFLVIKNARQAHKTEKATIKHSEELKKAMVRLENRNKDYAKMMKVMAHDLKNPLGGMVGISNLLLEEKRFLEDDREMLQLISSSGNNAIEMINQLLNSNLAIENEVLTKEKVDIQHLLRQCTELLQYKADEKQQKIIFISGGPVYLQLRREKIWRVFNNLVVNAIKFSPNHTVVKVLLERLEKSVRIAIIDQGIGVPENDKQRIFEMFTSAKRTGTSGEQPFGIGLSISKQIVESHQGKIWLQDNVGGGTIFYVELPLS
jgi:Signal transduction histidine kinase